MHATKPLPIRSWIYKSKYKYEFIQKRNYTLARVQRAKDYWPRQPQWNGGSDV